MMDERLAQRRKGVSEDRARKRLRTVLIVLVAVLAIVGGLWLVRSPVLSVSEVEITGASMSDPAMYVDRLAMGVGTPTIDIRAAAIADAVEADAWVDTASVTVVWPGTVVVDVVEHEPVSPVRRGFEWYLVSASGAVLESTAAPSGDSASVEIDLGSVEVGETSTDTMVLGAVEFVTVLSPELRSGVVMTAVDGGLFAEVSGHLVRLGRPVDLYAKATVLAELLSQDLEPGVNIDLIAPTRPAVSNPQPQVETEE
ncbi:MAG: cell division protein FtsQ/DivIB [Acidimicrobiia bacterium]